MPTARDIMTKDVITVKKEMEIKDLAKLFLENKINGFPVIDDDGKVIGMVTQGDLVEQNKNLHIPTVVALFDAVIFLESQKKFEDELKKLAGTRVKDIYNPHVITVPPDMDTSEVASVMADNDIHTLPVVDGDNLVGIIGKRDLIRCMT